MKRSTDHIRTTHTGSLPRPAALMTAMRAQAAGEAYDVAAYERTLAAHVDDTVRRQVEAGIDVVNDGECSKPSFFQYVGERLGGLEPRKPTGNLALGPMDMDGRDAKMFPDYYQGIAERSPFTGVIRVPSRVCTGPITYVGHRQVERDIANLKRAMAAAGADEGFLPSCSPIPMIGNEHYANAEEFALAYGEAMRVEYQAILDAGLVLQIDDPRMVSMWDSMRDESLESYRKWMAGRVALLNHALRGLPTDRIRYHTCYGVNFGPRISDLQLADVIDVLFTINAGAYSFEAANARHEHEWRVPQRIKVPDGKILIPGGVTHSHATVEHPEAVADRIELWARAAGRENVIFGNDCGFQSTAGNTEIPTTVAWAKLRSLGEGARIASKRLWN